MAEIKSQKFVEHIRQFKCPNCGGELALVNKKTKYVACKYCGTVSDPRSEASKIIMKLHAPSKYPPFSFLRIGLEAEINGYTYKVIGRTRWKTTHHEYWKEGYYQGYGLEHWVYDEWLFMGERFDYFYLVEDEEGFYVSKNILPKEPTALPIRVSTLPKGIDEKPDLRQPLNELGSAQVLFFEGESTYSIKPGDTIHFAEYKKGNANYVIEWRVDESNQFQVKEVEFFKEETIDPEKVLSYFKKYKDIQETAFYVFTKYRLTKRLFGWMAVLCLFLALIDYQPYILNETWKVEAKLLENNTTETVSPYKFQFDSVFVQTASGDDKPLTPDLLVEGSPYSELKDPSDEFAVLTIDTTIMLPQRIVKSTYKFQNKIFPIELQKNKNYYLLASAMDSLGASIPYNIYLLEDKNQIVDTLFDHDDFVISPFWFKKDSDFKGKIAIETLTSQPANIKLSIQKETYSSFAMLLGAIIFTLLWLAGENIADLVFKSPHNQTNKK